MNDFSVKSFDKNPLILFLIISLQPLTGVDSGMHLQESASIRLMGIASDKEERIKASDTLR